MESEEMFINCNELVAFFEQKKITIAESVDITGTFLVHILGKEAKSLEHGLQVLDNIKEQLKKYSES